jgi:hypothetical protein
MRRLNGIGGVSITEADLDKRPAIPLKSITSNSSLQQFIGILNWAVGAYRSSDCC